LYVKYGYPSLLLALVGWVYTRHLKAWKINIGKGRKTAGVLYLLVKPLFFEGKPTKKYDTIGALHL
jgi:hypothetical protein